MKRKCYFGILLLITISISIFYFSWINSENINFSSETTKVNNNMLSMMLEQTEGVGDYKTVTQSNWPTEGYIFNAELSKCENNSTLSWDNDKNAVIFQGRVTDKCYVYFDKYVAPSMTLVEYVLAQYTGVQGENNIYYHTSSLANGASDNSYRYAGSSDSVNNFVCFGTNESPCPTDNLYRIIGVFGDNYHGVSKEQLVKLIKYDYANTNLLGTNGTYNNSLNAGTAYKGSLSTIYTYRWNNDASSNTWSVSLLNKTNLNTNFINNIGAMWANKIATVTWKVGGNTVEKIREVKSSLAYTNELISPAASTTESAKIGLMYVSDYYYAASPSAWTLIGFNSDLTNDYRKAISNNWMYMGWTEWAITRRSDIANSTYYAFEIHTDGSIWIMNVTNIYDAIRPSFFLDSSIMYKSGVGTMEDPIRIS